MQIRGICALDGADKGTKALVGVFAKNTDGPVSYTSFSISWISLITQFAQGIFVTLYI